MKKKIFGKSCLTLFVSGREKNAFLYTLSVLTKFFGVQNSQSRKDNTNSGFSGNCPKPKMTPFFEKGAFFGMGEKVDFTNCVFEKLCSSENIVL